MSVIGGSAWARGWLFGPRLDLLAFSGSALFSLLIASMVADHVEVGGWAFLLLVVCVDVAHVWSTLLRVYLDREVFAAKRGLYVGLPVGLGLLGIGVYALGAGLFWRLLAYFAVFHFVRQQVGFVRLYAAQDRAMPRLERWFSEVLIYEACFTPIAYWHAYGRDFHWFVAGDFIELAEPVRLAMQQALSWWMPAHLLLLPAFTLLTAVIRWRRGSLGGAWLGRVLLMWSTFLCWHVGIISRNGDLVFTLTNVLLHGIPYMVLCLFYACKRESKPGIKQALQWGVPAVLAGFIGIAVFEELCWDELVWHDYDVLNLRLHMSDAWLTLIVPLLVLPQLTHYVLDGIVWRRKDNPELAGLFNAGTLAEEVVSQ